MLTFDEEVVERSETKSLFEHRISNKLKDILRAESVKSLVEIASSVLP